MHFIPTTLEEEIKLLKGAGVSTFSDLIEIIPKNLRLNNNLGIGHPASEIEIEKELQKLSSSNKSHNLCFAGGGIYDHYIPKVVDFISGRSEFYTAYTPYQAEVSQGTLQYLYEFQTMICELSGMDIANASLYDGASALAEACILANSVTHNNIILYSNTINLNYIHVVRSCLVGKKIDLIEIPQINGVTDIEFIKTFDSNVAALIIQSPNRNGLIENWQDFKNKIMDPKALFISVADPFALSVLKSPGDSGADIYVGEGQSIGNSMNYAGPLLGLIAVKDKYKRRIPGRIIGKTIDKNNKDGYVLTLQTREQHIRRERATSNICTNQGLLALRATIYLSLLGPKGLPDFATICYQKAHYTAKCISEIEGFALPYSNQFLMEFVVKTNHSVKEIIDYCDSNGILIMPDQSDESNSLFTVAVTERRTIDEINFFVKCLRDFA